MNRNSPIPPRSDSLDEDLLVSAVEAALEPPYPGQRVQNATVRPRLDQRDRAHHIIDEETQRRAFRSAQRHTHLVRGLKIGLPLIAIAIVVGFVSWVIRQNPMPEPAELATKETVFKQDELVMQNPRLKGYTNGRAYEVVAQKAIQQVASPDVVNLNALSARITDEKEQWVSVTAQSGRFDQKQQILDLSGAVNVKSSIGYGLVTDAVNIEMEKGYMRTESPVTIRSADIELAANQLEAIDNGDLFRFSGAVKLRIDAALLDKAGKGKTDPMASDEERSAQPQDETKAGGGEDAQ